MKYIAIITPMFTRPVKVLYKNRGSEQIHVGELSVERRGGQRHAYLTKDDRSTVQAAAMTHGEWLNRDMRTRRLREAGITRYPAIQRPRRSSG